MVPSVVKLDRASSGTTEFNKACVCVDLYHQVIPQSPVVERLLQRLMELLGREAELQQELLQVLGILDTLFASLTPRKEVTGPAAPPIIQGSQLQAA